MKKVLFTSMILTLLLIMCVPMVFADQGDLGLTVNSNGIATWNRPSGLSYYELQIWEGASGAGSLIKKDAHYTSESFNLKEYLTSYSKPTGYYEICIFPNDKDGKIVGMTTGIADWYTYHYSSEMEKLSSPANLRWDGTTAKWDTVKNATKYNVYLYQPDGHQITNAETSDLEYDFYSKYKSNFIDGIYFEVEATNKGNYRDSNISESPKYKAPVEPTTRKVTIMTYDLDADDYNYGGSFTIKYGNTNDTSDSSNSYTIEDGTSVTLTAVPDSGYKFLRWEISGGSKQTNATCTFKVSADVNYMAVFEKEATTQTEEPTTTSHKVTVVLYETEIDDYNYGGKITIKYGNTNDTSDSSNSYTIEDGTSVTLTAVPDSGYKFLRWEISGGSKQTNATCTFKVSSDVNYMAVFEKETTATEQPTQQPTEQPTQQPTQTEQPTTTPTETPWEKASQWAEEELNKANTLDVIPEIFKKQDLTQNITRREFAHVAVKLYEKLTGSKAVAIANNPFIDTDDVEVLKAYNVGITQGTGADTFTPDALITREQMATMMTRALTKAGIDTKVDLEKVSKFADDGEMHDWGKASIYYMSSIEIIKGVGNNTFNVLGNATREQALLISERSAEKFAK